MDDYETELAERLKDPENGYWFYRFKRYYDKQFDDVKPRFMPRYLWREWCYYSTGYDPNYQKWVPTWQYYISAFIHWFKHDWMEGPGGKTMCVWCSEVKND